MFVLANLFPTGVIASTKLERPRLLLLLPLVLGIILLMACGGGSDSGPAVGDTASSDQATDQSSQDAPPAEGVRVIEINAAFVVPYFQPDPIVLKVGEPVQFRITSADTRHTFTITELGVDEPVTQTLLGETAVSPVITPQVTGTFLVFCRIHLNAPVMEGVLQVTN